MHTNDKITVMAQGRKRPVCRAQKDIFPIGNKDFSVHESFAFSRGDSVRVGKKCADRQRSALVVFDAYIYAKSCFFG